MEQFTELRPFFNLEAVTGIVIRICVICIEYGEGDNTADWEVAFFCLDVIDDCIFAQVQEIRQLLLLYEPEALEEGIFYWVDFTPFQRVLGAKELEAPRQRNAGKLKY
jgi:hypothetical protein